MRRSIRNFNIHPEVFELFKTDLFKFPSHQVKIVVKCPPPPARPSPTEPGLTVHINASPEEKMMAF